MEHCACLQRPGCLLEPDCMHLLLLLQVAAWSGAALPAGSAAQVLIAGGHAGLA